jgi:predicted RNA binding protein with dsRBD fold (UPF0201 family)
MDEIVVRIEAEINFTENEGKVRKAVANIFDNVTMEVKSSSNGSILVGEANGQESLFKFRRMLSLDRIRNAARKVFFEGLREKAIRFCLNKQVAFAGHVSFCEETAESPLGPLKITIECAETALLIDWLAERSA